MRGVVGGGSRGRRRSPTRQSDLLTAECVGGSGRRRGPEFLGGQGHRRPTFATAGGDAADAIATLRDELWRAVDAKVRDVRRLATDGWRAAEWLAAAQTVTTGAGDRAAASELVDQQIKPFVDNDIRSDWLGAMHAWRWRR